MEHVNLVMFQHHPRCVSTTQLRGLLPGYPSQEWVCISEDPEYIQYIVYYYTGTLPYHFTFKPVLKAVDPSHM